MMLVLVLVLVLVLLGTAAVLLAMLLPNDAKLATLLLMLAEKASCMREIAATAPVSRTGLLDLPPLLLLLLLLPFPAGMPCDIRLTLASGVTRRKPLAFPLLPSASSSSFPPPLLLLLPNGASSPRSPAALPLKSQTLPRSGLLLLLLVGLLPALLLYSKGERDSGPAGAAAGA
jgi:hypothetical protein